MQHRLANGGGSQPPAVPPLPPPVAKGSMIDVFGNVVPPIALDQVRGLWRAGVSAAASRALPRCSNTRSAASECIPTVPLQLLTTYMPILPHAGGVSQLWPQGGGGALCATPREMHGARAAGQPQRQQALERHAGLSATLWPQRTRFHSGS